MQTIGCPNCGDSLDDTAQTCESCGEVLPSPDTTVRLRPIIADQVTSKPGFLRKLSQPLEPNEATVTLRYRLFHKASRARLLAEDIKVVEEEDQDDEIMEEQATWQKVVGPVTPETLPVVEPANATVRIVKRFGSRMGEVHHTPGTFFWLSSITTLALLLGGAFGLALAFGRQTSKAPVVHPPTLTSFPQTIALGGIVTIRGTAFTPTGKITLSRDGQIDLLDTDNVDSLYADVHGAFSDTFVVDPLWLAGFHSIYALDMKTHQKMVTTITVTGENVLQGPPHLLLSESTLDLGSGDTVSAASGIVALSNGGGGEVSWQASSDQPWLQAMPQSGTIESGKHASVIIAGDRSSLAPGSYQGTIKFTSNVEEVALSVKLEVVPLQAAHQAIMQLSTPALAFSGVTGSYNQSTQTLTVSNPGVQTLTWGTQVATQNGSGWLTVNQTSGSLPPGNDQALRVSVNTRYLSPGTYRGTIVFSNQGPTAIQGDWQTVYITLTVMPVCTLSVNPNSLTFSATAGAGNPGGQAIQMSMAQGCSGYQPWNAQIATRNGGNWLSLNSTRGTSLARVQANVDISSLAAGTYNGTLTFNSNGGQQLVQVTLVVAPMPTPVACGIVASGGVTLQGTAGQTATIGQTVTLATSGSCPHSLKWTSSITSGGSWLSATASGTLNPSGSASLGVQADLSALAANSYSGVVTVTAVDSVTNQTVGIVPIAVTLTALQPCTLQTPSTSTLTFAASASGATPTSTPNQIVTLSVVGNCTGVVTVTSQGDASWLQIAPGSLSPTGGQVTFTVSVDASSLSANTYTATLTFTATDGSGTLVNSPQKVTATLVVSA